MEKIIVITAPSGAGKTTLVKILEESFGDKIQKVVTSTTRAKRSGEEDGRDYFFYKNQDTFLKKVERGKFFEWELDVFPGVHYGAEKRELEKIFSKGKIPIIVCEVNGATKITGKSIIHSVDRDFLNKYEIISFFIYAPLEILQQRILDDVKNGKRNDTEKQIEYRFARLEMELGFQDEFDFKIDNSVLPIDIVANELINKILYSEKYLQTLQ